MVGRPFSSFVGGIEGLQRGDIAGAGENILAALRGEERFGTIDLFRNLGIDTETGGAKAAALISDIGILGILDPVNFLTFGATKVGRVAKLAGNLPATRVERAKGGFSAVASFGGQRTPELGGLFPPGRLPQISTPRVLNVAAAKVGDVVGGAVSSRTPEGLKALFRSRRADELANPEVSEALKDLKITSEDRLAVANRAIREGSKGVSAETQRKAALFLEERDLAKTGLIRVPLNPTPEQVEDAINATLIERKAWIETRLQRMDDGNFIFPDEAERFIAIDPELARRAEFLTDSTRIGQERAALIGRIEEQEQFIKGFLDEAGEFSGKAADRADFTKAQELLTLERTHLLESNSRVRNADILDEPIQEYGNRLRILLDEENQEIRNVLNGGTFSERFKASKELFAREVADKTTVGFRMLDVSKGTPVELVDKFGKEIKLDSTVQSLMNVMQPIMDDATEQYMSRVRKYAPDASPPIDNFLTHFWTTKFGGLFLRGTKNIAKKEKERIQRHVLNGPIKDIDTVNEVADLVTGAARGKKRTGLGLSSRELKGDFDTLKKRQLRFSAAGVNAADLGYGFEDRMAWMVNQQMQDATRWSFAHDAHEFMAEKHGITAKAFAALDANAKRAFAPLEFHIPWVPAAQQPFAGQVFIPVEMKKLMGQFINHSNEFTNDQGFRALLDAAHSIRRIWSAWTLAPFPAFHARNLASQFMLMRQGGVDLKKKADREFFRGAAEMLGHNKLAKISRLGAGPLGSTQNATAIAERLAEKFKDPNITEELLVLLARREDLVQHNYMRDVDLADAIGDSLNETGRIESFSELAKSIFDNPLKPAEHGIIRFGFNNVGKPIEDIPRFTMFLKVLDDSADAGADFERSVRNATAHTRQFLADPSVKTLSAFESDILKALVPFYQWSRFNIPQQIRVLGTRPDLLAPYFRTYNGAQNNFEGEFDMKDAPDWLRKNLAMPLFKVKDADGTEKISLWNPQGWVPLSEVNEIADILRSRTGAGKAIFGKLAPWIKEPLEQLLNVDSFRERELAAGQTKDMFGITMPDWVQHIMLNIRLFSEFDRLNPLDAWTELGQWRGSFTKGRPHRLEATHAERWLRFYTGFSTFAINPDQELVKKMRDRQRKMQKELNTASRAVNRGQIDERDSALERAREFRDQFKDLRDRLNERRELVATTNASREAVRNPQ